jgi:outer membrane protein OmpA-like peptidoglycan-associated protein
LGPVTPEIAEIIAAVDSTKVESPYAQILKKVDWDKFRENMPRTRIRKNLSLYFDVDTMGVNDIHKEAILKIIAQYDDPFSLDVQVTGFADDDGDAKFNNYVSVMRAKSVADFMILIGMTADQITFEGKGKQTSNMAKHQNRRVEILVTD